jgi:predicted Zn-dependent peptidase
MKTRKHLVSVKKIKGYTVIVVPAPIDTVVVRAIVGAGNIHETKQTLGINHLLEHCIVSAWKKCHSQCVPYWDKRGCILNASTDATTVNYYIKGLPDLTDSMVQYIISIVLRPSFTSKIIQDEKKAVLSELNMSLNTPDYPLLNAFNRNFYEPVGLQLMSDATIQLENLSSMTMEQLYAVHQQLYTCNSITFVVYGHVTTSHITSLFTTHLTSSSAMVPVPQPCHSFSPAFLHVPKKSSTVMVGMGFPMKRQHDLNEVMEKCLSVLLFNELRTKHKLIYNVKVNVYTTYCSTVLYIQFECMQDVFIKTLHILCRALQEYTKSVDASIIKGVQRKLLYTYLTDYPYDEYYTSYLYQPHHLYTKQQLIRRIKSFTGKQFTSFMKEMIQFQYCTLVYQCPASLHVDWSTFLKIDARGHVHLLS